MMPSDVPPPGTPIWDMVRTLDSSYVNAMSPSDSVVWLMEMRVWHELQMEMFNTSCGYMTPSAMSPVSLLGSSVVMVPHMTGVTLYDDERAVSFNMASHPSGHPSVKQIPGHIDWLALIKSGARAVA